MKRTADRLFGERLSLVGARRRRATDCRIAAQAVALGGNVRVGLEDSLWIGKGRLAKSTPSRSPGCARSSRGLALEVATPDEAREILQLKGGDKVGF